jgi:PAS domain S-box-containing protein
VALPAAGIMMYSGVFLRNYAINDARMDTQRLADRIASEQRLLVSSVRQLLVSLSQLPEFKEKDAAKVNTFLRKISKLHPNFSLIYIADRTGTIWASSVPFAKPITIYDRRYFKNALASGQLSSGEFQVGRLFHKPTFNLGYPYRNNQGEIIGVICVQIDLMYYGIILEQTQLPNNANMVLLDHKGVILFSATNTETRIGKLYDPVLFKKMLEGPDADASIAVVTVGNSPPQERYISYKKLRLQGEQLPYMYVRVGIPVESILSQANKQILKNFSSFILVLASALFLAWLVGKRSIADRIALLERASQSLANGDLRSSVSDLIKGGELGRLGESFDAMAQQLASRDRFLNSIIDTEPECLKMLDADGRVQMMNRAGLRMIDAETFDQVNEQSIYPLITDEYRDAFVKLTNDVFQGVSGTLEFEAVGLKGRRVWLDIHVVPFLNDVGEIVSLLGITRDITDRKVAEKSLAEKQRQLEELNLYLEQRIADGVLDSRNKDQMLELQGRQVAMGEMIGNIAHQWRQPLNMLGLIVQELLITYGRDEFNRESLEGNVKKAMGLIMHMSQTIEDFSNYFKPDKEKKLFNINKAVAKTLSLVEPSLKKQNINIQVIGIDDTDIYGYENEYSQVLLNILLNCRDAFEGCNIDRQRDITITVFKENSKSVVAVTDNAGGIPENVIDKIFDQYFTTKGPDKGTGIGLFMSKAIIEKNMGGRLTVRNTADGAEFRIEV